MRLAGLSGARDNHCLKDGMVHLFDRLPEWELCKCPQTKETWSIFLDDGKVKAEEFWVVYGVIKHDSLFFSSL